MNLICYFVGHSWARRFSVRCDRCGAEPYDDMTLHEWAFNFHRFVITPKLERLRLWGRSRKCWKPGHDWSPMSDRCLRCGMSGEQAAESGEWSLPEWRKLWRAWLSDLPKRIFMRGPDFQPGRWYLAGPMSGLPQFNIPAFDAAAKMLRDTGLKVISPAELDAPEIRAKYLASTDGASLPDTPTWGTFLSRDVKIVADQVKGVILMPGWEKSRGARLEAYVGLLCGHQFLTVGAKNTVKPARPLWIKLRLWEHL